MIRAGKGGPDSYSFNDAIFFPTVDMTARECTGRVHNAGGGSEVGDPSAASSTAERGHWSLRVPPPRQVPPPRHGPKHAPTLSEAPSGGAAESGPGPAGGSPSAGSFSALR